ncbi:disulfide bond formation protein B [uncultured Lentibacter sp.]|jgi:disulfide bond formation protein DsbB|uniref:disulfide bond formation protein B n=1 Tax=uncultured Lentibacter sp. TaxID=1659309 RepID=UPI0026241BCF|nr:disulfide bond formation protein B [uncultured Lentibacter sp.]
MTLSRTHLILLAGLGSGLLMAGALGFQYLGDMPPCKLCYWQRYPHIAALVIALVGLRASGRVWPLLGAGAALTTAAIGLYHTGVERKLWQGPSSCSSGEISGLSGAELLAQILSAPIVRCDEAPWELLGLSMASWNAVASIVLALVWLAAARRRAEAPTGP